MKCCGGRGGRGSERAVGRGRRVGRPPADSGIPHMPSLARSPHGWLMVGVGAGPPAPHYRVTRMMVARGPIAHIKPTIYKISEGPIDYVNPTSYDPPTDPVGLGRPRDSAQVKLQMKKGREGGLDCWMDER